MDKSGAKGKSEHTGNRRAGSRQLRLISLAAILALGLAGCGGASGAQGADSAAQQTAEQSADAAVSAESAGADQPAEEKEAADVTGVKDCYRMIADVVSLPAMYEADDDFLMNYYGIDASLLREYVFASCEDAARVDTVILMRLKDEADAQTVIGGLDGLLAQMEAEMDNYNPGAYELVKEAAVRQHGDLIDLVISADRDHILAVIDRVYDQPE